MELYLAMDLKGGKVVWGYKGEREHYECIEKHSLVVNSSAPAEVLKTLRPRRVYIADLDAIEGRGRNEIDLPEFVEIAAVDRGYKSRDQALKDTGGKVLPVLGSETYSLREVFDGVFVSLDFKGRLLGSERNLKKALEVLNSFRLKGVIVLDISRVGTSNLNFELVEEVLECSSNPVYAGGGVRDVKDLERLEEMGVKGAIVATAIHRKAIPVSFLKKL